jgi:predicted RNA-binding Zn-ribbon protein involved in translation (DUF1610 family)
MNLTKALKAIWFVMVDMLPTRICKDCGCEMIRLPNRNFLCPACGNKFQEEYK